MASNVNECIWVVLLNINVTLNIKTNYHNVPIKINIFQIEHTSFLIMHLCIAAKSTLQGNKWCRINLLVCMSKKYTEDRRKL